MWENVGKSGIKYIYLKEGVSNMTKLTGTFECKIDNKGRILLPSQLKKQLDGNLKDGFIIKRSVFQSCLELYPMVEWKSVMEKINSLNRFIKKNNDFIRIFSAGVRALDLDSNGRLLVPIDLITNIKLKKNVVMASAINIIEIWDKDQYEKSINDKNIDFVKLTEQVMGNQNNELS